MKRAPLLAVLLLGFASLSKAQNLDITGISLGSPYVDATSKLTAQRFRISPIKLPANWPQMVGMIAAKEEPVVPGSTRGRRFEYFIVQAIDEKVVYVAHEVTYGDSPEPNDLETVNGLLAKYGKPTAEETPDGSNLLNGTRMAAGTHEAGSYIFLWYFNAAGKVTMEGGPERFSCSTGGGTFQGGAYNIRYIGPVTTVGSGVNCAKAASGRIYGDPRNGQLVGSMYVVISDVATLKAFFTADRKAQQDRVNQQGNSGKAVKAPL